MALTLSQDLRDRVVAAIDDGMSRNAAAERFGVAVATAIRWVRAWRTDGLPTPRPKGGDLRSQRIERYRDVILVAIGEQVDITLVELSQLLRDRHGASLAPSTIWRFLDRHGMTFKKQRTPASRSGQTSPRAGKLGLMPSRTSTRRIWSSSMKPEPQPRWRASADTPSAGTAAARPCRMGTGRPPRSRVRSGSAA